MRKKFTLLIAALALLVFMMPTMVGWGQTYEYVLVKNISELSQGDVILITNGRANGSVYALGTTQNTNNRKAESVTVSSETISDLGDAQEITLESTNANGYFTFKVGSSSYLYAANTSSSNPKNYLKSKNDNSIYWELTINTSTYIAAATDKTSTSYNRDKMKYNANNGNPIFSCYYTADNNLFVFKKREAGGGGSTPSISANTNPVNISYDATGGTISYTVDYQGTSGTVTAEVTAGGNWLTAGTVNQANSTVPLTCSTNDFAFARPATVRLTYTYGTNNATVTTDVTVTQDLKSDGYGSEDNPLNVAQACTVIDDYGDIIGVYATGIVSEIVEAYSSQYHNISYNISTDGTTDSDQLECFRGKSYNGENFTSAEDIQVGATVVVYGNLTKYGQTYEFAANNQLVSYIAPVVTTHSLTFSASPADGGTLTVGNNLTSPADVAEGATINISAEANTGYVFGGWTVNDTGATVADATSASTTFTMGTADATLTATFTQVSTYTVTYHANLQNVADIEDEYSEGEDVTVRGASTFTYEGHIITKWTANSDGTGDEYALGSTITDIDDDYDLWAYWEEVSEVSDCLDYAFTGISGTSYSDWSGKTGTSGAVYAGNSNAGVAYIQLRATSPSGIVSTTSGGKVKKVTVTWNTSTVDTRTLDVYAKNTAYDGPVDLYSSATQGTKLGSIVCGTSTELTIDGDYEYIGLRSNSGAMYLDEICITWESTNAPTPTIAVSPDEVSSNASGETKTLDITIANLGIDVTQPEDYLSNFSAEFCSSTGGEISPRPDFIAFDFAVVSGTYVVQCEFTGNTGAAREGYFHVIYNDGSTINVASNVVHATQDAYVAPVASITVAPDEVLNVHIAGINDVEHTVTLTNMTVNTADNLNFAFCDENGTVLGNGDVRPEWIEEQSFRAGDNANEYILSYNIVENDGAARTAYFKVWAIPANGREGEVYSNLVTVTQDAYVAPSAGETGTINFGNNGTKITSDANLDVTGNTGVTGDDSNGNTWTITSTGTTSFSQNTYFSQVGKKNEASTNITFTMTLPEQKAITSFTAKFGGYSTTAGTVSLKIDNDVVGSGNLDGTNDVVVSISPSATTPINGTTLTVIVLPTENEGNGGVKCYYISYTYETGETVYTLNIAGYGNSTTNGWHLIASPVGSAITPSNTNGFIPNNPSNNTPDVQSVNYDLYIFDQVGVEEKEWLNYKVVNSSNEHVNFSTIENGKGYLYASKYGTTLTFTGTPYGDDGKVTLINNVGENTTTHFGGWNLIGNPFGTAAVLKDETGTSNQAYYKMNSTGTAIVAGTLGDDIAAMEGVFVVAATDGEKVTFNPVQTAPVQPTPQFSINVSRKRGDVIDRAIVRFDEGGLLPKFQLNPNNTKIYITEGNQDYAVVRGENEGEMPVSFKASENGNYTLSVNIENMEMSYLHLIDNMTGADVDLLATPSYSFEARTTDYASRFRLVFSANTNTAENGSETFAYYNGSEWVISNMGEATLQVVDVMGRVLSSETVSGNANVSLNQTPGVYMLRLVNSDSVKTQKIVVR